MKKSVSYTVEESILLAFDKVSKDAAINKSKWIENQMKKFVEVNNG